MNVTEAIEICNGWFAYLQRQRDKSMEMQKLAALARTNPEEARRRNRQLDMGSVTVYDGGRLEPAVRYLVKLTRSNAKEIQRLRGDYQFQKSKADRLDVLVDHHQASIAALEAKIDALMLEYCPNEMTPAQRDNWAKHRVRVDSTPHGEPQS